MKFISFFIPNLHGGGAEKVVVNLLKGMELKNVSLDLVLADASGPYLNKVSDKVRIVNLGVKRVLKAILPLSNYLQQNRPDVLVSHINHANVAAILARKLSKIETKLVLVEHDTLSAGKSKLIRGRFVPLFMKLLYPYADTIIGVSQGVSEDLALQLSLPKGKVSTIYNPIVDDELLTKAKASLDHPWFQNRNIPVFLAVGRLTAQKDFANLIKAFALLRKEKLARLLILGEGESRGELETMIKKLEITQDVSMPGFVENPYAYMYNASALILSSRWEGLPTVLVEAMACGCPVVSTDCPSGPREILGLGKYGTLVPVGDALALSNAMLQALEFPVSQDLLLQRALEFSIEQASCEYLALFKNVCI